MPRLSAGSCDNGPAQRVRPAAQPHKEEKQRNCRRLSAAGNDSGIAQGSGAPASPRVGAPRLSVDGRSGGAEQGSESDREEKKDSPAQQRKQMSSTTESVGGATFVARATTTSSVGKSVASAGICSFPVFVDDEFVDTSTPSALALQGAEEVLDDIVHQHEPMSRALRQQQDALRALKEHWAVGNTPAVLLLLQENPEVFPRSWLGRLRDSLGQASSPPHPAACELLQQLSVLM